MPDDLATLESERSQILEQFLGLGDLRPGSITAVVRRCGKPSCHCANPHAPGHDPQLRLTRRVAGKTVTETFPNPAAFRKAQLEVAEFHRFQELSEKLVSINQKICQLRPVERDRGGCNPYGNGARSEPIAGPCVCRAPTSRWDRSASGRNRLAHSASP